MENHRHHDGLRAALQLAPTAAHSDPTADVGEAQRARLAAAYAGGAPVFVLSLRARGAGFRTRGQAGTAQAPALPPVR